MHQIQIVSKGLDHSMFAMDEKIVSEWEMNKIVGNQIVWW